MSPERAKVFIAEDDEKWRQTQRQAAEKAGHEVVLEVDEIRRALDAVAQLQALGVNVALVDGSIPIGKLDGMVLTRVLKDSIPDIKVVDVSGFGDVQNADAKMPKWNFNSAKLGQIITDL